MKVLLKLILSERCRIAIRLGWYKFSSVLYIGNTYYCNCCNRSFRKFNTYGFTHRANARCPYCNSVERERLIKYFFSNYFLETKPQNISILHFAPEKLLPKFFKSFSNINYFGVDINPLLADYQIDINDIKFGNDKFDIIICSHVLAHVQDERIAIEEMKRVLKPEGFILILTYIDDKRGTTEIVNFAEPNNDIYIQNDKVYRYPGLDFSDYLARFDLDVVEFDYKKTLEIATIERYCLGLEGRENFYICK